MKKLVIDGNSVYEIDEDCVRRRRPSKECGIYEHLSGYDPDGNLINKSDMGEGHRKRR